MQIEATVTRTDIFKMQVRLLFKLPPNLFWLGVLILILGISSWESVEEVGLLVYLVIALVLGTLIFAVITLVCFGVSALWSTEKNGIIGPHRFTVTDAGFIEETSGSTLETNWAGIRSIYQYNDALYIMISMYRVHVVSSRSFPDRSSFLEFANQVKSRASAA